MQGEEEYESQIPRYFFAHLFHINEAFPKLFLNWVWRMKDAKWLDIIKGEE